MEFPEFRPIPSPLNSRNFVPELLPALPLPLTPSPLKIVPESAVSPLIRMPSKPVVEMRESFFEKIFEVNRKTQYTFINQKTFENLHMPVHNSCLCEVRISNQTVRHLGQ